MPRRSRKLLNTDTQEEQLLLKNRALAATEEGITISDPSLPDNPLIYANEGFERLTGYSVDEVIGRNCRFLQGPDTDPGTVDVIREALRLNRACTVEILNYRKDGTPFWNRLSITPVRDDTGKVTHHIGVQSDITARKNVEEALREAKKQLEAANQRMTKDLHAAARIQRSLLPSASLVLPGVDFAWAYEPATELAGDLLNIFVLDADHIGAYVLDVSGHGVASALLSMAVSRLMAPLPGRSVMFSSEENNGKPVVASPSEAVTKLNKFFPFDPETAQYFTLLYCVLNLETRELRYTSAGHLPPILAPAEGCPKALETTGPPVGLLPSPDIGEQKLILGLGDRIYLCTDGIVEAENQKEVDFGTDRLFRCLSAARKLPIQEAVDLVLARVSRWLGSSDLPDDASMMGFEIKQP